jgi:hypothetical protein
MASIYLRYSPVPVVISQSYEKDGFRDENGELIPVNFPNQWGSYTTSFASSGWISLAAGSGIFLNTPGYVDASGLRVNSIIAQNYMRMDDSGSGIALYPGNVGSLLYKQSDDVVGTVPQFVFNTGINKLTSPISAVGHPFYVSPGNDPDNPTKEVAQFLPLTLTPKIIITTETGPTEKPASINISGANFFTTNITIGTGGNNYKGALLTHQGEGQGAEWIKTEYLEADGALWNRYPKRPVRIEQDRIIFYGEKPKWAILTKDFSGLTIENIEEEFSSNDTVQIIFADTLSTKYVKPALNITFPFVNRDPDTSAFSPLFETTTIDEPADKLLEIPAKNYAGYSMYVCPIIAEVGSGMQGSAVTPEGEAPADEEQTSVGAAAAEAAINAKPFRNGYAFSVKKGAYLDMQLGRDATSAWACADFPEGTGYKFKPSTANTISMRPNIHTSFNTLAENIDFLVYGKYSPEYDNYESNIFGLNDNRVPSGLIPAFMIDANINNAVSGTIGSGVLYTKYLDRAKSIPSGYLVDETPKVCVNTNKPYVISSIVSGLDFLSYYASLTVSGVLFSNSILAEDIYLSPKPLPDNSGKYITNALLTVNAAGQIVSRQPLINPTIPDAPTDIDSLITGNNEFTIKWVAGFNGGAEIVGYLIEFSANNGNVWTEVPAHKILKGSNTQTSCTIIGLETSISYLFRIKAQNSVGISSASAPSAPLQSNNNLPQSPKNFVYNRFFGESNISEIELSWTPPDSVGASDISGYIIEESDNNGLTWIYYNSPSAPISNTSEILYGLSNDINYTYRLSCINNAGQSTFNFIYSTGNIYIEDEILIEEEKAKAEDVLSNWDFGSILFTGVCAT